MISSRSDVAVFELTSARRSSSTENFRPFTATMCMPFETPAANAGMSGCASSTVPSAVTCRPRDAAAFRLPSRTQGSVNMFGASV